VDVSPAPIAIPVLHAVTNDEIVGRADFLERARAVMKAMRGRGALQLRAPRLMDERSGWLVEIALMLAEEQERTGAWLVVNDRVDLALIVCARGVQLTGRSLDVGDAAQVLMRAPDCGASVETSIAIGASIHTLEEAIAARLAGAAWGVVSAVGPTESRRRRARERDAESGTELLGRLVRFGGIPIIAIGGVLPEHVASLRALGAHGVAAIRGVWDVDHSEGAVLDYLSAYDSEVGR
jgi:thiamine-phosphate diphosphorylase